MSVNHISKDILSRKPGIKFVGILRNGSQDISIGQDNKIDENNVKLSMIQTPHLLDTGKRFTDLGELESVVFEYDKMKLINLPTDSEVVICGTDNQTSTDEIKEIVSDHIPNYNGKTEAKYETNRKDELKNNLQTNENLREIPMTSNHLENSWQNYILTMIEFWKEMAITSIKMNEKMIKEFWKNYKDK